MGTRTITGSPWLLALRASSASRPRIRRGRRRRGSGFRRGLARLERAWLGPGGAVNCGVSSSCCGRGRACACRGGGRSRRGAPGRAGACCCALLGGAAGARRRGGAAASAAFRAPRAKTTRTTWSRGGACFARCARVGSPALGPIAGAFAGGRSRGRAAGPQCAGCLAARAGRAALSLGTRCVWAPFQALACGAEHVQDGLGQLV